MSKSFKRVYLSVVLFCLGIVGILLSIVYFLFKEEDRYPLWVYFIILVLAIALIISSILVKGPSKPIAKIVVFKNYLDSLDPKKALEYFTNLYERDLNHYLTYDPLEYKRLKEHKDEIINEKMEKATMDIEHEKDLLFKDLKSPFNPRKELEKLGVADTEALLLAWRSDYSLIDEFIKNHQ